MKRIIIYPAALLLVVLTSLLSCTKQQAVSPSKTAAKAGTIALSATGNISLAVADTLPDGSRDTLYLANCYSKHSLADSISAAALPSAITTYLTANYAGYTFRKGFTVLDSTKAVTAYIVIIKFNNNFVGLKFNAAGTFVSVLKETLGNPATTPPSRQDDGPFGDRREGPSADTLAVSALPTAVSSYFKINYPADTLLHAALTHDSTYVIISKDTSLYATDVTSAGKLIARVSLQHSAYSEKSVTQTALPAAVITYLTTTYPGYVFNKAYTVYAGAVLQGYGVLITANNSCYFVLFNASGSVIGAKTLH